MKNHSKVLVERLPYCDIDASHGDAHYDAKTKLSVGGRWGFLCEACFAEFGVGLGLGKGQKLIVREPS